MLMGHPMQRVLFATVYPTEMAYTRLRAGQFRPYLEESGMDFRLWTFISPKDVGRWFAGGNLARTWILLRSLSRLVWLSREVRNAAAVVVLREVLPFGPPVIERLAARKRPLVWDVDDAVWESYPSMFFRWLPDWFRKTGHKYEAICGMATEVWAGSEVLAEWCRRHNDRVKVVPTVVEVPRNRPDRDHVPVVGWIGSPSTGGFVEQILPALEEVEPRPHLIAVGSVVRELPDLAVEVTPWSQTAEEATLSRIAVGLYPIDVSHPLAEGKAGFKAILYMSQGIPVVVTPTPTNASIVRDGVEGLHARTMEDWTHAVARLLTDRPLWDRCSRAAHERALSDYSLQRWGPKVASFLSDLIRS